MCINAVPQSVPPIIAVVRITLRERPESIGKTREGEVFPICVYTSTMIARPLVVRITVHPGSADLCMYAILKFLIGKYIPFVVYN